MSSGLGSCSILGCPAVLRGHQARTSGPCVLVAAAVGGGRWHQACLLPQCRRGNPRCPPEPKTRLIAQDWLAGRGVWGAAPSARHTHTGGGRPTTCLQRAELDRRAANKIAWKQGCCSVCAQTGGSSTVCDRHQPLSPVDAASLFPGCPAGGRPAASGRRGDHEQKGLCVPGGLEVPACSFRGLPALGERLNPRIGWFYPVPMRKRV